jgi:hypothetical protein
MVRFQPQVSVINRLAESPVQRANITFDGRVRTAGTLLQDNLARPPLSVAGHGIEHWRNPLNRVITALPSRPWGNILIHLQVGGLLSSVALALSRFPLRYLHFPSLSPCRFLDLEYPGKGQDSTPIGRSSPSPFAAPSPFSRRTCSHNALRLA